jgi:hypothetical protein
MNTQQKEGIMYNKFNVTSYLTIILMVISFTFPANSFADWVDKSDELPGMDTDYTLVYVAGAVLVASLIFWVASSGDDDGETEEEMDANTVTPDSTLTSGVFQPGKFSLAAAETITPATGQELSVIPFVGLKRGPKISGYNSNKEFGSVVLGVSVNF